MKFKLSIGDFLVNSTVSDLEFAPVTIAMVHWIKQLRQDCGFIETSDGRSCNIGLKSAKDVADLLRDLARKCQFNKDSFIVDTDEYPQLLPLLEQSEILLGKSQIVQPIGVKIAKIKTSEDILKQAANQLIKGNFFKEAIDVLYILQSKVEEQ